MELQQENGMRAGTENVVLVAGLGAACRVAKERLKEDFELNSLLRNRLQELLFEGINGLVLNGSWGKTTSQYPECLGPRSGGGEDP